MAYLPTDVVNQALDAIGCEVALGDLEEGTREAQVCLRAYLECVNQMLRGAHWDFARKTAPLTLLADATGQTPNVGTQVPVPWTYEYQYPNDCVKARFVPLNPPAVSNSAPGNISIGSVPLTGVGSPTSNFIGMKPAKFTVATDFNYLPESLGQYWEIPGVSPIGQTVILTNVQNAQLVYTAMMAYPSVWTSQFRAAVVAYLASEVALSLTQDKKLGMVLRDKQIMIAKEKLKEARITDGNEGWYSTDHTPDWMRARSSGGRGAVWQSAGEVGLLSWDSVGEHDARMFEKRLITWEQDQKAKISKLEKKSEDQRVTVQEPCDTLTCELNDDHSAFSYPKPNAPRPVMPYHKGRYKAKHTK